MKNRPCNNYLKEEYKKVKAQSVGYRRKLLKQYYTGQFNFALKDPKRSWKYLNTLLGRNPSTSVVPIPCLLYENNRYFESEQIAENINKYFVKVGQILAKDFAEVSDQDELMKSCRKIENSFFFTLLIRKRCRKLLTSLMRLIVPPCITCLTIC